MPNRAGGEADKAHPSLVTHGCRNGRCAGEPGEPEEPGVVAGVPFMHEVGQDFADDGAEFEAVSGAGRCDDQLWEIGQAVDQEVPVGWKTATCWGGKW